VTDIPHEAHPRVAVAAALVLLAACVPILVMSSGSDLDDPLL